MAELLLAIKDINEYLQHQKSSLETIDATIKIEDFIKNGGDENEIHGIEFMPEIPDLKAVGDSRQIFSIRDGLFDSGTSSPKMELYRLKPGRRYGPLPSSVRTIKSGDIFLVYDLPSDERKSVFDSAVYVHNRLDDALFATEGSEVINDISCVPYTGDRKIDIFVQRLDNKYIIANFGAVNVEIMFKDKKYSI